jgi:uncharacterized protein
MEKALGGIGWIEIGTADPAGAERFYGGLFGWTFQHDGGREYRELTTGADQPPSGGLFDHGGLVPNYAIFYVQVEDVPKVLARAELLGGKTLMPPADNGDGLVFAHLTDPSGSHFGIYSAPAGR